MKKLYFLLVLLLFIPSYVNALEPNYNIDGFYVDATVQENGDMLVKEQIVMNGSFNGYIRDLFYKGNYILYDASQLDLTKVCELNYSKIGSFDISNGDLNCFNQVNYGSSGDSYVYERTDSSDNTSLKMYNYTENGIKIFYIEYLLKDVIVVHNDVAELYWTFIGYGFDDDIADIKITVNLPNESSDLRVWAHGSLQGNIAREDNKRIVATIKNLYANNLVDIRATFDKSVVPLGSKLSDKDAFSSILAEEKVRADEANRKRETAQFINYSVIGVNIIWIFFAVVIGVYAYKKYDKEHKSSFNLEYHREFPAEYGPEVVEYLMKKNVSTVSLSAMVLNVIRKKGLEIREEESKRGVKQYVLVKKAGADDKLTAEEAYVVDWFINLGDGKEVSLRQIEDASETESCAKDFVEKYDKWNKLAKMNGQREEFYEDNLGFKVKGAIYAVLGFFIFIFSISLTVESYWSIITLILSIILFVYIVAFTKRTIKGNDHFVKWNAFKKFLLDFGRFKEKELPEIVLWDKYLVYATVFGIADKVSKAMEIKVKSMGDTTYMPIYSNIYFSHYFASSLVHTVSTARTMSISKIASTSSSSGSGFGGGFSGGGGFGGGGGGGGGRGF